MREPPAPVSAPSLATRLADSVQRLATGALVLLGTLSLTMIAWLLLERSEAQLRQVGTALQVEMTARIDLMGSGLNELSRHATLRNALVDVAQDDPRALALMQEHLATHPHIDALWLLSDQGAPLGGSQRGQPARLPRHQEAVRELAQRAISAGRLQTAVNRLGEHWHLLMSTPVRLGNAGVIEGAVVSEVRLPAVLHPLHGQLDGTDRLTVSSGADLIHASGPAHAWEHALTWPVQSRAGQGGSSQVFMIGVHRSAWQSLGPALWAGTGYALLGTLLVLAVRRRAQHLAEDAVQPLRMLSDAARAVAEDGRVEIPALSVQMLLRGGAEVQGLADSFADMLERLFQAQATLEQTVARRTEELAQAKLQLDSTLSTLADGVYSLSVDRESLLFATPPVHGLLGIPVDEAGQRPPMVRATMAALLDDNGRDALELAFERLLHDGHAMARMVVPVHGQPGEDQRWLETRMILVRDAQGQPLRIDGTLSDVSAAVRAREAREQALAGLSLRDRALSAATTGVLILALQRQGTRAVYANPAMSQITGASNEELLAADGQRLLAQTVGPEFAQAMQRCVSEQRDVRLTTRVRRLDGEIIWCEASINPMVDASAPHEVGGRPWIDHVVLVIDDVTEFKRQKERHERVIDSISEVIFQTDAQGRWTYLSPAWQRLTGWPVDATLGGFCLDVLLPDDQPGARVLFEELARGERQECRHEARFLTAEGATRWMSAHVQRLEDEDGQLTGLSGTLADVTEQRATEEDLRLRNRAIDASTNSIVLVDVRKPGRPVVFVNEGFTRVTGYRSSEAVGRSCSFLQNDDRDQPGVTEIRQALASGEPCRVLLRNYRKNGERFDNDLSIAPVHDELTGEVTHFIGISSDVTQRLQAERLLRDQFARLDTVLGLSPDGFVSFDAQGRVAMVNPAFESLLERSRSDLVGMARPEFEAWLDSRVEQRNPPGMATWLEPSPGLGADQADRLAQVLVLRGTPARVLVCSRRDVQAPNVSHVLHLRDITRETEVDRMKSEFLSTAAHELRTPMASIRGFSDLLMMRKFDEARTRDLLQTINRQSIWLTDMVNELLDLARIEARKGKDFELEVCELSEVLEASVGAMMVPGDLREIERHLPPGPLLVRVDRSKFLHATNNVLSNAYKYSPNGGRIMLAVLERVREGQPQLGVSVRDEGIGMKPEHAARAFERFFRADASGNIPGTGLGLALVKEIIELHGGQVELASALGEGTTVTMWLPRCTEPAEPAHRLIHRA